MKALFCLQTGRLSCVGKLTLLLTNRWRYTSARRASVCMPWRHCLPLQVRGRSPLSPLIRATKTGSKMDYGRQIPTKDIQITPSTRSRTRPGMASYWQKPWTDLDINDDENVEEINDELGLTITIDRQLPEVIPEYNDIIRKVRKVVRISESGQLKMICFPKICKRRYRKRIKLDSRLPHSLE